MFKISLIHTNGFAEKNPPNKIDAHKCVMSSEKYRWTLTNKRIIQLFRNSQWGGGLLQSIFMSRHTEHTQLYSPMYTLTQLRCKKLWRGAVPQISHGPCVFTRSNKQLPRRSGAPSRASTASRQTGRVTTCHTQYHTILRAHQYFGTCFAVSAVKHKESYTPFWTNMAERRWVASTSSFCSFQKFPFSVLLVFSPLCTVSAILCCLLSKSLMVNAHNSS